MKEYIVRASNNKFTIEGEIVHCKDCEFCTVEEPISRGIIPDLYCLIWQSSVNADVSCSYGERKEKVQLSPETQTNEEETSTTSKTETVDLISRQAAIEALGEEPDIENETDEEWAEHDTWVIHRNAIASLPPVEPPKKVIAQIKVDTDEIVERIKEEYKIKDRPVCEDAISRADTIKAMCSECEFKGECGGDCTEVAVVRGMPSVVLI